MKFVGTSRVFRDGSGSGTAMSGIYNLDPWEGTRQTLNPTESPVVGFPSASRIREISSLPELIRRKLDEPPPGRGAIVEAFATYLAPFVPASHNDWTSPVDEQALDNYSRLVAALRHYVEERSSAAARTLP